MRVAPARGAAEDVDTAPVRHVVRLHRRTRRILEVTTELPPDLPERVRVVLPTWTPGSYLVRDHVRHLRRLTVEDGDGAPIAATPDGISAWSVPTARPGPVRLHTEWYADERTIRTTHVDERHALIVGAATFLCVEPARARPQLVRFEGTEDHEVFTTLGATPDGGWEAADYDALADAAFEVGRHPTSERIVDGAPHRVVWAARRPPMERLDRLADDLGRIAAAARDVLGPAPLPHGYTVLVVDGAPGGLEHRDGATIALPDEEDGSGRSRDASLLAHEYLHLWNGRRLSPRSLIRPPLDAPVPTPSLWVTEGWTSYYDLLLPARAGVLSLEGLLEGLARRIEHVAAIPGVRVRSLRDASRSAWTKHYRPDADTANTTTDYYTHGSLVALELDLAIRALEPDSNGLDDVLRLLWERHGQAHGFDESDVLDAIADLAGTELARTTERLVATPCPPDPLGHLATVGITVTERERPGVDLGVRTRGTAGTLEVVTVLEDGPAWQAGLAEGDRLRRLGDRELTPSTIGATLASLPVGERLVLQVERDATVLDLSILTGRPRPSLHLEPDPRAAEAARASRSRWLGRHGA